MVLLDVDSFLLRLQRMYQAKKAGGSVWLTFKRVTPDHRTRAGRQAVGPKGKGLPKEGNAIMLARATDGKVKLSTEVSVKEHIRFQIALNDMMKTELDGLKKRDRTREKKEKKARANA